MGITTIKAFLVGMRYYGVSQDSAVKYLSQRPTLQREPHNPHDRNAIAIVAGSVMVGQLERFSALVGLGLRAPGEVSTVSATVGISFGASLHFKSGNSLAAFVDILSPRMMKDLDRGRAGFQRRRRWFNVHQAAWAVADASLRRIISAASSAMARTGSAASAPLARSSANRSSAVSVAREIELKLEICPDDLPTLNEHPLLAGLLCKEERQTSIYFDTVDGRLRDAGVMLRVRESGGRYVQTVKADGAAAGGLFDRGEWESELDQNAPDFSLVKRTALATRLGKKLLRSTLQPAFETVVDRSQWHVMDGGDGIELVLDRGEVVTPAASAPIMEVELELKCGSASRLFDIARELNGSVPLRLGVLTKSERGYRLLDGARRTIVKAEPIALSGCMTAGQGFQTIAMACIRQFRLNEPLFTGAREGEALHQARVAFRRLRSAMSLFKRAVTDDELESIRGELRWISGLLGAARDLDVFVQNHVDPATSSPELWSQLLVQREAAFDEAIAALGSQRFRTLMISLAQWVATGEWLSAAGEAATWREQPLGEFASAALARLWRKLRTRGRNLAALNDGERHRVRIAAKKLRYASEFFAGLYGGRKRQARHAAFVAALEHLQDQLGSLNDIVTADRLSGEIASRIAVENARQELLDSVANDVQADKRKLLTAGEAAFGALVKKGRFWR